MEWLKNYIRKHPCLLRHALRVQERLFAFRAQGFLFAHVCVNRLWSYWFRMIPHKQLTQVDKLRGIASVEANSYCTGCSACAQSCPKGAIELLENIEGFLVPHVDSEKCTRCGECNQVCPILHVTEKRIIVPVKCFAAQAVDDIRLVSSSGGVFTVLAANVLTKGGAVCGAAWVDDFHGVKHRLIYDVSELDGLRLSKYVQSELGNVFEEIEGELKSGRRVMFVGTPCQVAGLKSYLGNPYDNLLLVDLVCCGVPSRKVYRKFLDEEVESCGDSVVGMKFRLKDRGWHSGAVQIVTKSGIIRCRNNSSAYQQAHFRGLSTNKICEICPFDTLEREGDITIGDFWGIDGFAPSLDDDKGTSLVLVNTVKGDESIAAIRNELKVLKQVPVSWALRGNANLIHPIRSKMRRQFFHEINSKTLSESYSRCIRDAADCIIFNNAVTSINYGSILTAYALQELVVGMGYYAKILNHARVPVDWTGSNFAGRFAREYLNLTEVCQTDEEFLKLNAKTDVFVVGSDQMWRTKYWPKNLEKVLLAFAEPGKSRIACAISFGVDCFEGTLEERSLFKRELEKFDLITVREEGGIPICHDEFSATATWILDPVFIVDPALWMGIAKNSDQDCSQHLVYYGWEYSPEIEDSLNRLAKKQGCVGVRNIALKNLSVEDWLASVRTAKMFVSNSFHGICFAILFRRKFVCVNNIGQDRFDSLLRLLGLSSYAVAKFESLPKVDLQPIDYKNVLTILQDERVRSYEILETALKNGVGK